MKLSMFIKALIVLCTSVAATSTTYCLYAFLEEAEIPESLLKKQIE